MQPSPRRRVHLATSAGLALLIALGLTAVVAPSAQAFYWPAALGWPPKPTVPQATSVALDPLHTDPAAPGYWTYVDNLGLIAHGDAKDYGTPTTRAPSGTVVANPVGSGYWVVDAYGGGVHNFGDAWAAPSLMTTGYAKINDVPISDAVATPDGKGLLALDNNGHVWTLGTARSFGDVARGPGCQKYDGIGASAIRLNAAGTGYWILGALGEVWVRGSDVAVYGDGCNDRPSSRAFTSMAIAPDGRGYWLVDNAGTIVARGSAARVPNARPGRPVTYLAALPSGGVLAAHTDGAVDVLRPQTGAPWPGKRACSWPFPPGLCRTR